MLVLMLMARLMVQYVDDTLVASPNRLPVVIYQTVNLASC